MYIIEVKYEGIMGNYVFDDKEQALNYIKEWEEKEYENKTITIIENTVMGKYDIYEIIKLERRGN